MPTEEGAETTSPLDELIEDIRQELVRRTTAEDRNINQTSTTLLKMGNPPQFEG